MANYHGSKTTGQVDHGRGMTTDRLFAGFKGRLSGAIDADHAVEGLIGCC
ncbi:MAG: hypothetical protein K0A94_06490 [Desulfuromonadales bacterium]|nr:hypothetical protein [Desulfuromonadales bacterium]